MSAQLHVLDCGAAVGLQDGGRRGYLRYGLSGSGPMDRLAQAMANALVGNPAETVAIEFAMSGAHLRAEGGTVRLALAGAPCALRVDGQGVADHRSFLLRDGDELLIAPPRRGVFAYLAAAGGFQVNAVMGSTALHRRAALGGVGGRGLRSGDRLAVGRDTVPGGPEHMLGPAPLESSEPIRVVLGPQETHFAPAGLDTFLNDAFTVSNRADRMGYQLDGPAIAHGAGGFNIVSDATVAGSVQVPGNGRPIVLLADRQTTGGYPKIATVISHDLRRIAQRRPGETVRFAVVDLGTAVDQARARAALVTDLPNRLRPAADAIERLLAANVAGEAVDALDAER